MGYKSRIPSCLLQDTGEFSSPKNDTGKSAAELHSVAICASSVRLGHPKLLQYHLRRMARNKELLHSIAQNLFNMVVSFGSLKCLKVMQRELMWNDPGTPYSAAVMGDMRILRYFDTGLMLSGVGTAWIGGALEYCHLDVLDWACKQGYLIKRGFMNTFIDSISPPTFDWYIRKFGQPKEDTMKRIRDRAAAMFHHRLLPRLNDPKDPYPGADILVFILGTSPFMNARSGAAIDAGILLNISIKWDICVQEVLMRIDRVYSPSLAEATVRLALNLGLPTTCAQHPEPLEDLEMALQGACRQIVTGRTWGTFAADDPLTPSDVDDVMIIPGKSTRIESICEPAYEPISPTTTNEELVDIINDCLNKRSIVRPRSPESEIGDSYYNDLDDLVEDSS